MASSTRRRSSSSTDSSKSSSFGVLGSLRLILSLSNIRSPSFHIFHVYKNLTPLTKNLESASHLHSNGMRNIHCHGIAELTIRLRIGYGYDETIIETLQPCAFPGRKPSDTAVLRDIIILAGPVHLGHRSAKRTGHRQIYFGFGTIPAGSIGQYRWQHALGNEILLCNVLLQDIMQRPAELTLGRP